VAAFKEGCCNCGSYVIPGIGTCLAEYKEGNLITCPSRIFSNMTCGKEQEWKYCPRISPFIFSTACVAITKPLCISDKHNNLAHHVSQFICKHDYLKNMK
jgi:hypothetical protein